MLEKWPSYSWGNSFQVRFLYSAKILIKSDNKINMLSDIQRLNFSAFHLKVLEMRLHLGTFLMAQIGQISESVYSSYFCL